MVSLLGRFVMFVRFLMVYDVVYTIGIPNLVTLSSSANHTSKFEFSVDLSKLSTYFYDSVRFTTIYHFNTHTHTHIYIYIYIYI